MLTPFMRFKGGKGVATAFGMLVALVPALVGFAFLVFAVVFALSHYISLGSCSAAIFLGVAVWFRIPALGSPGWVGDKPLCVLMTLLAAFVVFKHRANIGRLARGTENKIYLFGSSKK
jgi:glycerol-3-phosphate acyltransferase PlsY